MMNEWEKLNERIVACERCPRLRRYCREVAEKKRRSYLGWNYWGMPVPNFGDPRARLLIVSLAPAAHGANRTGRMFTGDRSGDFLYRALFKAGFSSSSSATRRGDGLKLTDCAITATLHCAPPANRPAREEIHSCSRWLEETAALVPAKVFLALGQVGWNAFAELARAKGWQGDRIPGDAIPGDHIPRGLVPKFSHGAAVELIADRMLLGCYHPSQRNTFTGRLTEPMLDEILHRVRELLDV